MSSRRLYSARDLRRTSASTQARVRPSLRTRCLSPARRASATRVEVRRTIYFLGGPPQDQHRILRQGANEWTCLPGFPGWPHDEPACFDPTFMQWMKESLAGREPHIDRVGISYMYAGAWVPNKSAEDHGSTSSEFHVGPHIMIVSPHQNQQELQTLSHDGSTGMPYVTHLPNGTDLFLVIPIRQWDEN
jgi:hypothetical protein